MIDLDSIPKGCTPKDAQVLRKANHEIAQQNFELNAEVEKLKALLSECKEKFIDYEIDVDSEKPYSHIKFMRKLDAALAC